MCSRPERKRRWRRRHIPWADVEVTIGGEPMRGVARAMQMERQLVCEMRLVDMRRIDRVITEVGCITGPCLSCAHLDPVTLTCAEGRQPTVEPVASPFPWLPGRTVRVIAPEDCEEWEADRDA